MRRTELVSSLAIPLLLTLASEARADDRCDEASGRRPTEARSRPKGCPTPLAIEVAVGAFSLDPRGRVMNGSFGRNAGGFAYAGDRVGHTLAVASLGARFSVPFERFLYAGAELDLGLGATSLPSVDEEGYSIRGTTGGFTLGLGAGFFGGFRLPLSYVSLRLETFLGVRSIRGFQDATDDRGLTRSASVGIGTFTFEPRAYFDVWVAPHVTLGAFAGFDAGHFADRLGGVTVGYHTRAHDTAFLP